MTVESLTTPHAYPAHDEPAVGLLSRAPDTCAPRILITGLGLLTPLGPTAGKTWDALLAGRYISDHARATGGFDPASPRVIQMARRVADQALAQAAWDIDEADFATVVGTSKGSVESWLPPAPDRAGESNAPSRHPYTTGLADIAAALAGRGPKLTVSAACASGLLALIRGAMMIQSGEARRVLVVAVEASVHPLFLGSFRRLGVLPAPGIGCRPFDETRDGFLMSEAAAAVCLEANSVTPSPGTPGEGLLGAPDRACTPSTLPVAIERFAMAADASHLTAADPAGTVLTHLINKVTLGARVDLVHAHGTGTVANDPTELAALDAAASARHLPAAALYSHKGALGHSLGAAGLVSITLNVLAHQHGTIPPNVRTTRPLPCSAGTISPVAQHRPVRRSLALAAGFGGAMAAVGLVTV